MSLRILVVGAAGFIGQHLVRTWIQNGIGISALINRACAGFDPRVKVLGADSDLPTELDRCDVVVWLASGTTPASSAGNPLLELSRNLVPLLDALHALQSRPQRQLIYVSSGGTVYGDVDKPAEESLAPHARSYYAAGKVAAEQFIEAWCRQYRGNATVLRPSNVYGPGQTMHGGFGVIPAAMDCLIADKPMRIWGDGESLRDYIYIDDFTAACTAALHRPASDGMRVFNVCSGQPTSLNQLLAQIQQVAGRTLQLDRQPARTVDLRRVLLDGSRLRNELDWAPHTSLQDGLLRTWRWIEKTRP